ncbi:MAG: FAD-dependent oxidoreductase [Acidimicrobiales bacterium]
MDRSLDVVVVGAGIGGLGAALSFTRAGHRVTIVERDDTPMPADVEDAFEWDRRGAPQVRHPHALLGLARTILRDRFPDVLQRLTDAGVHTVSMAGVALSALGNPPAALGDDDDDLQLLACRRTTFEWVLRRIVLAEPNVELRVGMGVAGLVTARPSTATSLPTVVGVRMEDGSTVRADLVVASTGRRSDLPRWLAEHGVDVPETSTDAGVVYFSRFYRSDEENTFGFRGGLSAGVATGVIGADAGTYSITAVIDKNDRELRAHLSDSDRFDATMRLMPELSDVVTFGGTPTHPVHLMAGLINRLRRFTDADGNPLAVGVLAVGDAHTCTNPAYGRGQSLALLQATMAADAVAAADDLAGAARRYEAASAARVEPWYHFSVMSDQLRPLIPGNAVRTSDRPSPATGNGTSFDGLDIFGALSGVSVDPELMRLVLRVINLLESPQVLLERLPDLQRAAAATKEARAAGRANRPRRRRISRDEILAVVA